jgi:hypothetical protein
MPVRFLSRSEWEAKLRSYGCRPLEDKGQLNSAEWWLTPWGSYPFTVPTESDGRCDQWAFQRLIAHIVSCAPEDWKFPE